MASYPNADTDGLNNRPTSTDPFVERGSGANLSADHTMSRLSSGLSTKLLWLTVLFVMLSEILIYVPSLANFRNNWLADRLERAAIALHVAQEAGDFDMLSEQSANRILDQLGVQTLVVAREGSRQLIAMTDMPSMVTSEFRIGGVSALEAIAEALQSLVFGHERTTRVVGAADEMATPNGIPALEVEIIIQESELRDAMVAHSINILQLSLMISLFTATLVFLALRALFVRPFRAVTRNMLAFSADPEKTEHIITKTRRADEIGILQNQLHRMQGQLQMMLLEKRTLADLGLAVSKINHDLRNILASAVLFSDRLQSVTDPAVQRFTPKLVRALDRAIDYCQSTLAYGSAREAAPAIRTVHIGKLVDEVADLLAVETLPGLHFENRVSDQDIVAADPDQLLRVLLNLSRNALGAMGFTAKGYGQEQGPMDGIINHLIFAVETTNDCTIITISDTGPGIPTEMKDRLFEAFQSGAGGTKGGTGLGLAIAAELVQAHGGQLVLNDTDQGASFSIHLPNRQMVKQPRTEPIETAEATGTLRLVAKPKPVTNPTNKAIK